MESGAECAGEVVTEVGTYKTQLYDLAAKAYAPETRPAVVAAGLKRVGAEKYLTEKQVSDVASLTTAAGLIEKTKEVAPVYCPTLYEKGTGFYEKTVEKYQQYAPVVMEAKDAVASRAALARDAEGRRELLAEGRHLAETRLVAPVKEVAAPYIQKFAEKKAAIVEKKDAIFNDKRLVRALSALKEAREHPVETATALKATALDLLKYEKFAKYREYVQSEAFAADTRRLVMEDLPQVCRACLSLSLRRTSR